MRMKLAVEGFLVRCRIRGLTESTIRSYKDILTAFQRFVGDVTVMDLNNGHVNQYILELQERGLAAASIATHIRHVKAFVNWLVEEKEIEPFPHKIWIPKTPKKIVKIYSAEELRDIFEAVYVDEEWIYLRNCLMVSLMLDSGIRQNEVCQIKREDVDMAAGLLKVHGKGNKERLVPFGKFTLHFLRRYIPACPFSVEDYLLLTRYGGRMNKNTMKLFIQRAAKNISFELSCHKLRHNFATNYCLDQYDKYGTVDIYKLMVLMGHEDTLTTRRYLHMANQIIASKSNVSHLDKLFSPTP